MNAKTRYQPGRSFLTTIHGRVRLVIVVHYHGAGTVDVKTEDGRHFRLTGMPLV